MAGRVESMVKERLRGGGGKSEREASQSKKFKMNFGEQLGSGRGLYSTARTARSYGGVNVELAEQAAEL